MVRVWLSDGGDDSLASRDELANEFKADASRGADDEPRLEILVAVEDAGDLVHDGG